METRTITAEIPVSLADQIDQISKSNDQPRSWAINQALSHWVDAQSYHYRMTLEGIEDIKAGRVVSHERVCEWIDSLDTDHPLPMPEPCK